MNEWVNALRRLFRSVVGLVFWLIAAALGLALAAVVAVLLLVGVAWALLRGRRPVRPVYVHQFQAYARERVWPGRRGNTDPTGGDEVVDVQVREVHETRTTGHTLPPGRPATER